MKIDKIPNNHLEQICNIIGDTGEGLTGSEIGKMLALCNIADVEPSITKRKRLFSALYSKQEKDGCGNNVCHFIQEFLSPVRYVNNREYFDTKREDINIILAFVGLSINEEGKLSNAKTIKTLTEAEKRAKKLKDELYSRKVHADVYAFCKAELLQDNYFHAVFEAVKSIADKLRTMTGFTEDGAELIDKALSTKNVVLAINTLQTETEISEQKGFGNLIKGVFGLFRNTTAHEPKIKWKIEEQDAIDLLTMASYIRRKLDDAVNIQDSHHI